MLVSAAIAIQGSVFVSRPKLNINKSNLFEKEVSEVIAANSANENAVQEKEPAVTDSQKENLIQEEEQKLALELLGTVIGNPKDPIAFIKDLQSEKQGIYRLGSKVQDAKLIKIVLGEVVLERNGKEESLKLSKRARSWGGMNGDNLAIISINGDQIIISRKGLLNEIKNVLPVLPKVKVKPYYEAKKATGLVVDGIPENSVIVQAGIRNKDVLKTVNNQVINSYQKALQVFNKVKNQQEIKMTLLRGGRIENLNFRFEN